MEGYTIDANHKGFIYCKRCRKRMPKKKFSYHNKKHLSDDLLALTEPKLVDMDQFNEIPPENGKVEQVKNEEEEEEEEGEEDEEGGENEQDDDFIVDTDTESEVEPDDSLAEPEMNESITMTGLCIPKYVSADRAYLVEGKLIPAEEFQLDIYLSTMRSETKTKNIMTLFDTVVSNGQNSRRAKNLIALLNVEDALDEWMMILIKDFNKSLRNALENPILNLPAFSRQLLKPRTITSMVSAIRLFISYLAGYYSLDTGGTALKLGSMREFYQSFFVVNDPLHFINMFIKDMVKVGHCQAQTVTNKLQAIIRFICYVYSCPCFDEWFSTGEIGHQRNCILKKQRTIDRV